MRIVYRFIIVALFTTAASASDIRQVSSPPHRVVLLELYTSEGCSSCPPADRFLSGLRQSGVSNTSIIPLAFHVTYWDYIGWKDVFGQKKFDLRQRALGRTNQLSTIYTPQFLMAGKDFRRYQGFSKTINHINAEPAVVDLKLALKPLTDNSYDLQLSAATEKTSVKDVALFIAVVESGLTTHVKDGENEGETLEHDYVVRELYGPQFVSRPDTNKTFAQQLRVRPGWNRQSINIVGFAQNLHTGKVLQAVSIDLLP